PLCNVGIPRGLARAAWNATASGRSVLQVARASDAPSRDPVSTRFERRARPNEPAGVPGKERVTRFGTAPRFELGPGTSCIDYFNKDLMPGLEMSGGDGLFQPRGRLPACFPHFHQ